MDGQIYRNMELRKLPPRFRSKLSQVLDLNDEWKKLMSSIPSESDPSISKYKSEHILLVERHSYTSRRSCGEIFLDEWSTSGRLRPTVETLYHLLQECQLFRTADFVAEEILEIPAPPRPAEGPAKRISDELVPEPVPLEKAPNDNLIDLELSSPSLTANCETTVSMNTVIDSNMGRLLEQLNNFDYQQGNLINFNLSTLKAATKDFDTAFNIGSGAFGTVYKLELGDHRIPLAIKLLHPTCSVIEEQFLTEINVLSRYRHENLVSLIGYCTNGLQFCLIYEFMSGGTLMDVLASEVPEKVLSWNKRIEIANGIIKGIHYLHSAFERPLIHRDIKSANILLDELSRPKIGDFGLAKSFCPTGAQTSALASTIFGTSAYMAPEAFRGDISPKMDVFSFGVILLEMITGLPPYDEEREGNDIVTYLEDTVEDDNIFPFIDDKVGSANPECANTLYSIAQRCLSEKKRRPTSEMLINDFHSLVLNFTHYCGKIF